MSEAVTTPAVTNAPTIVASEVAPTIDHGAFPPSPEKAAVLEKLVALRKANTTPSPFDSSLSVPATVANTPTDKSNAADPKVDAPKIEMDATTLRRLTALAKADRENKQKITQLEASSKDAASFAELKKLYAEGKRIDAIAKLAGNDGAAVMEALMADFLNPADVNTPDSASAALAAKVDELLAKDAAREKQALDAAERTRTEGLNKLAFHVLDSVTDGSLEICSRPENRSDASVAALEVVKELAFTRKLEDITPEQAIALYSEAFGIVEKEYEEMGQRFSKRGTPQSMTGQRNSVAPRSPLITTPQTRQTTIQKPPIATTNNRPLSIEEHKARAIDVMRGLRR